MYLTNKFEVFVSINGKTVALSLFSETCLKPSLADIFRLHKYQVLAFINLFTTRKR